MSNLSKRFATSILLLLIIYFAIINQIVLSILLIIVCFFVLVELFYLNRKIFNKKNILFCGSYFGYCFHEDGIKSSIDMLKFLDD